MRVMVSHTQKSAFEEKEVGRRPGFSRDKNKKATGSL